MMENLTVKDIVLEKKLEDYKYSSLNNLKADKELMVEITLNEYRDLVSKVAISQSAIDKANSDKYERERKIEALEKENASLKAELYELHKAVDAVEESEECPFEE